MPDGSRFDARLDDALMRYVARVPSDVDASAIVDALDAAGRLGRPRPTLRDRMGERWWARLRFAAAIAVAVALVGLGVFVGSRRPPEPAPLVIATAIGLVRATSEGRVIEHLVDGSYAAPRWSPDEQWLAAVRPGGHLAVSSADGAKTFDVAGMAFTWIETAGSGDQRLLVRGSDGTVVLVRARDGSTIPVTVPVPASGALAASERTIAWSSGAEVYVAALTPDGVVDVRLLTRTTRTSIRELAFSPDGETLAWLAADCLGTCDESLSLVAVDGPTAPRTVNGLIAVDSALSWDPSGSSLLVVSTVDMPVIALVDADDGRTVPLLPVASMGQDLSARPRWVAGGSAIFVETRPRSIDATAGPGGSTALWRIDPDGSRPTILATETAGGDLGSIP